MIHRIDRRQFVRTAALGSAGLIIGAKVRGQTPAAATGARPPNLLVLLPDGQRRDTLAAYGARNVIAPNLDALAARSTAFERTYVTQPICTPSRSSLMTGKWPHATGCLHNGAHLPKELKCLPQMMAATDYRFGYFGKWHLGDEVDAQHGFHEWASIHASNDVNPDTGQRETRLSDYDKFLLANNQRPDRPNGSFTARFASNLPLELSKPKFLERKACEFLERHQKDPFVLFVAFHEPHPPYHGPLDDTHPVKELALDSSADHIFGPYMPMRYRALQSKWQKVYGKGEKRIFIKAHYLGLVTEVDQSVGVILSKLDQLGLSDNTIVMHAADHGDMMTAHGLYGKGVMFEEAARIPWLVHLPGQTKSMSVAQPVSTIDFLPTLLDLLGQPPNSECTGKSLVPLIKGETMTPENIFQEWHPTRRGENLPPHIGILRRKEAKLELEECTRTIVTPEGWKLCLRTTEENELYDLKTDPTELQNLYGTRAHHGISGRLTMAIHQWQERVGDNKVKV